jgi:hypothetical protein
VHAGVVVVQGAAGAGIAISAGQQMAFSGVNLKAVGGIPSPFEDWFDRWAGDRNHAEDQSVTARYLPREVVGYSELDRSGVWSQVPVYGSVWYPSSTASDWAPYRFGHWDWVEPWGRTWVDDAPWGFAPFHYGRWTMIGNRWAWVPGRMGARPTYAPALVGFDWEPGKDIAWYPLAPGEDSGRPLLAGQVPHKFRHRPEAVTHMPIADFQRRAGAHAQPAS